MAETKGESPLLTVPEAARYLNVSVKQVWKLRFCRTIPCIKLGRCVRFHIEDLDNYIRACREEPVGQLRRYSA